MSEAINVFGLIIPVNQKEPSAEPPIPPSHDDLFVVRWQGGWALFWAIQGGRMEFGISPIWAISAAQRITKDHILPQGFQAGEPVLAAFELDESDEMDGLDLDMMIERYDWTTNQEIP
jgi:hypothetical protein